MSQEEADMWDQIQRVGGIVRATEILAGVQETVMDISSGEEEIVPIDTDY